MKAPKDPSTLFDSLCAGIAKPKREASETSHRDAIYGAVLRRIANSSLAASATQTDPITPEILERVVEGSYAPLAAIDIMPTEEGD